MRGSPRRGWSSVDWAGFGKTLAAIVLWPRSCCCRCLICCWRRYWWWRCRGFLSVGPPLWSLVFSGRCSSYRPRSTLWGMVAMMPKRPWVSLPCCSFPRAWWKAASTYRCGLCSPVTRLRARPPGRRLAHCAHHGLPPHPTDANAGLLRWDRRRHRRGRCRPTAKCGALGHRRPYPYRVDRHHPRRSRHRCLGLLAGWRLQLSSWLAILLPVRWPSPPSGCVPASTSPLRRSAA